ncbi:hypothetical protein JCM6882_000113 [Rhodosporidiobolus microsporus]
MLTHALCSSPSPHQFESLNQEDKAASTASEGVKASPPTSLLDLPDELLASIFDQVWQSLRPEEENTRVGILVPLDHILVNKRIFAAARPLWFRHLTTPDEHEEHDLFLSNFLKRRDLHPLVHSLRTEHPWHFPALHSTVIGVLSNLSSLVISFGCSTGDNDGTDYIPVSFTDTLKTLDNLRTLRMLTFPDIEDNTFNLARYLPVLRHLDVQGESVAESLLADGAPHLEAFTMRGNYIPPLPWASLKRLTLEPENDNMANPREFLEDLEASTRERLSLYHLALAFPSTRRLEDADRFCQRDLSTMLELLQKSHLGRFDLTHVDELEWDTIDIRIPSLKVLSLNGSLRVHEKSNLASLQAFLSMFPSLTTLLIEGFTFSPLALPQTADTFPLPAVSLAVKLPHLFSLLFLLRSTSVLEFRPKGTGKTREVRWTRNEGTEEFARECWTVE